MENPFQELQRQLNYIETLILELKSSNSINAVKPDDELLTIDQASDLLNLAKPTIYSLSASSKIPVIKKGKRLYFSRKELLDWLKSGRRKTIDEIENEAADYIISNKYTAKRT
ncbi:MAG: helix-turn-helix domain-containing protein [Janthinobacterium lividum]